VTLNAAEQALLAALREIQFGSIEAVVHDGRIVHFERREKVRFHESSSPVHTAHPTTGGSPNDTLRASKPAHRIDAAVPGDPVCNPSSNLRAPGERFR
jgi:hypothetical protein